MYTHMYVWRPTAQQQSDSSEVNERSQQYFSFSQHSHSVYSWNSQRSGGTERALSISSAATPETKRGKANLLSKTATLAETETEIVAVSKTKIS